MISENIIISINFIILFLVLNCHLFISQEKHLHGKKCNCIWILLNVSRLFRLAKLFCCMIVSILITFLTGNYGCLRKIFYFFRNGSQKSRKINHKQNNFNLDVKRKLSLGNRSQCLVKFNLSNPLLWLRYVFSAEGQSISPSIHTFSINYFYKLWFTNSFFFSLT